MAMADLVETDTASNGTDNDATETSISVTVDDEEGNNNNDMTTTTSLRRRKDCSHRDLHDSSSTSYTQYNYNHHHHHHPFEDACEFAIRFGLAAYKYGSIGTNIERFVVALVQHLGYPQATCRLTQSELLLCVHEVVHNVNDNGEDDEETAAAQSHHHQYRHCMDRRPQMWMVDAVQGNHMDKLGQLAELGAFILAHEAHHNDVRDQLKSASDVVGDFENSETETNIVSNRSVFTEEGILSLREATRRLQEIDRSPDPFGLIPSFLSWVGVGFALPPLLGSSWYDVSLGTILAGVNFCIYYGMTALSTHKSRQCAWIADWSSLVLGFVPGLIASIAKVWWTNQVNVAIVVVAAIAFPLPGYVISLGVIELIYNRITPGFGHLLQGMVTLLWLALGASVGIEIIREIESAVPIEDAVPLISGWWQFLFIPIITLCLSVAFQNSYRDVGWSVLCQVFSYAMAYVGSLFQRPFFGNFLSAVAFTLFANLWALYYNRPNTIIFAPSFVLSVSGSIGFRGLLNLNVGEKGVGLEQFLDMVIVALVTLVGIIAASALVQPRTTL
jgi:uncharacterized membrane protein YjjB (DUF3815 family)